MNPKEPTFFAGRRLDVYFKGGRLIKDKKTEQRFWRLKWAITMNAGDAHACGGAIQSNYEHIQARENAAEKMELGGCKGKVAVAVFAHSQDDAPQVLRLADCFLDDFSMTWGDGLTEFWLQLEHPLTDALHTFVKDYAFQRLFVEFVPAQRSLTEAFTEKLEEIANDPKSSLQNLSNSTGVKMSIHTGGKEIASFKPKGKPN